MNSIEKRAALTLSSVFALRMLGLFMLLPVFAVAGKQLEGYTPALIGVAIGAYGLTQALLQIPFGLLSDKYGRKPIIVFGLMLFALGSVIAAMSDSIWGVIIGRLLQGCGAIASAVMALAADLSRDQQRTKIMASIGMSIGAAFALAMILGPSLTAWLGLKGIFWAIAVLALIAVWVVVWVTPDAKIQVKQVDAVATVSQLGRVVRDSQLLRLNFAIFSLHFLLTSFFVVFPGRLLALDIELANHSWLYLLTLGLAVILMLPFIIIAEKKRLHARIMLAAVLIIGSVEVAFAGSQLNIWFVAATMIVFFAAFNLLEALLPSMISRVAPAASKGTALGVYSSHQFAGAFLGGPVAGLLVQNYGESAVFWCGALLALVWAIIFIGLKNPPAVTSYTLTMPDVAPERFPELIEELKAISGVSEAVALPEAGAVYLKVDKDVLDPAQLAKYSKA